ncbi:MAG TPA: PilC/PilY family type IV pilus protein [Thiobacillaceae bacterium]|nr:PilC/PilY family type IV pilus protein [Thiobacillaceae bacterium]HNU65228.1 PilC/PilY family type IV pilus protein [Thiobacillaceae bacterium]
MKSGYRIAAGMLVMLAGAPAGALNLADTPLFLQYRLDPNVMIDLSIESPMVGAAYNDEPNSVPSCTGRPGNEGGFAIGTCYFATQTYLGYFDPGKCYVYNNSRFEPVANKTYAIGAGATCSGDWSGNFLNWATMTAIDEFRWAMTGGHRSTDTATLTVLQRANQNLSKGNAWFPIKKIGSGIAPGNVAPATVSPYGDATLYLHSHGTELDVGTTIATNEKFTNRNVRVQVCDNTAGLEANCKAYGTSYKPEGLIQTYGDRMRFSLVSYLLDSSQNRDGGVLRARMKYTGPTQYVLGTGPGTGTVSNPKAEWNAADGTLIADPDSSDASASGVSNSGIINYINKFGAQGYKGSDPAGELYYEALRYFKNLGPTPEYSNALTATMKDGFPVITNWDDPIQDWCQKNFIVGINDANPWLDKRLPGTFFTCSQAGKSGMPGSFTANDCDPPSNPDPAINVTNLTNAVGQMEGLHGTWQATGTWTSGTASGANDVVGYFLNDTNPNSCTVNKTIPGLGEVMGTCPAPQKQNSYYIAGLAYYANTQDIRPDHQGIQTIATYMIDTQEYNSNPLDGNKNMLWLAGKYGGFIDTNGDGNPNVSSAGSASAEWDADGDGVPDNYVLANDPGKLVTGLKSAFTNILARIGSAAAVATNSTSLQARSRVYQAKFSSVEWSGQLLQFPVTLSGVLGAPEWDAGSLINGQAAGARVILTRAGGGGVDFQYANLSSAQQNDLDTDKAGFKDGCGTARVAYLRGDPSNEGVSGTFTCGANTVAKFRVRNNRLGDIVNSNPWYVGAPAAGYSDVDHPGYGAYRAAKLNRTPVVYVGGNDGMLHGVNAELDFTSIATGQTTANSGKEVLAYVPSPIYASLSRLTDRDYNKNHRYYVDGSPLVGDADLSATATPDWRSVLVGVMGAGGKGVFALDVSNPANFSAANAANILLWEFTATDDADMGHVFNHPPMHATNNQPKQLVKMKNGQWAVILGNGYNSSAGKAALYVLFIKEGMDGVWTVNTDYVKIVADSAGNNGLSSPVPFDMDGDGVVDVVYAGDLKGNMWKFLVGDANPANWRVAFSTAGCGAGSTCTPLFVAQDASSNRQPIIWPAEVTRHPQGTGALVLFGTGKYLEGTDNTSSAAQSVYGIWDKHDNTTTAGVGSTNLLAQTVTGVSTITSGGVNYNYRTVSGNAISAWGNGSGQYMGWYVDLPTSGERTSGIPKLINGVLYLNTFIPSSAPCDYGGTGWLMAIDYLTGGNPPFAVFTQNPNKVAGFQVGAALGGTTLIQGTSTSNQGVGVSSLTTGNLSSTSLNFGAGAHGRVNWRELVQ